MELLDRFRNELKKYYDDKIFEIGSIKENENVIYARVEMIDKNAPLIPGICHFIIEKDNPNVIKLYDPFSYFGKTNPQLKDLKVIWKKE